MDEPFDAPRWVQTLTRAGGGYALNGEGQIAFLVANCTADDLTSTMAQIVGNPDRLEAVKRTAERLRGREALSANG
jgi:hypothetical protein